MTSVLTGRPAPTTPRRRRGTARRAVARWAWRLFRREWRQQVLIVALLTAVVAVSVGLSSAVYVVAPVRGNADFGAASHFIRIRGVDPQGLAADVAAARAWFGAHEVIYHREVRIAGLFEPVDYRGQDPVGPLGGPRLSLLDGVYPRDGQLAVTDGIADLFSVGIGSTLALDGVPRAVVGVVENPANLSDEFVLLPPSPPGADAVTILVDGSDEQVNAFRSPSGAGLEVGSRQSSDDVIAAVFVLALETLGLLLIALVAAASFVVIAHRRMRQLGMLAAIGATQRHLRLVTLVNGAVVGAAGAVLGAALGFSGWVAAAPLVEKGAGFRVAELDVPPWLVAVSMLLAVVAGTAAAWWPAQSVARVAPVRALSGRPPAPRPARRVALPAALLTAAGVTCLALGGDVADQVSINWTNAALLVAGTVSVALGAILVCPLAVQAVGAGAGRLPVAVRLAVRDLARFRARSGAALAAVSLTLGVTVTIIGLASAAQATENEGNLPENQVLVRAGEGPFIPPAADLPRLQAAVDRVAASFTDGRVTSFDVALDPAATPEPPYGLPAISLARRNGDEWVDLSLVYIATPRLLAASGYDLDPVPPGTLVLTREIGELAVVGTVSGPRAEPLADIEPLDTGYSSLPGTFTTTDILRQRGWVAAPAGHWLVDVSTPPTAEQLATARAIAAGAGLTVEVRDTQAGIGALRTGATAAGVLAALAIVAMVIGLVRSEAGRDLRILTATGATRRTRRTLTAATTGTLAVLGTLLGTAAAYLGLVAGFARDLAALYPVPIVHLSVILFGLPLVATATGWLVAGRTPNDIARQPMA